MTSENGADWTVAYVTEIPPCDMCSFWVKSKPPPPAAYDAVTKLGAWAFMCEKCFAGQAGQLGEGKGQRLELAQRDA